MSDYQIKLATETFLPKEKELEDFRIPLEPNQYFDNKFTQIIQFYEIPNSEEQARLSQLGLELVDYIPNKAFFAVINQDFDFTNIQDKIRSIFDVDERFKLEAEIFHKGMPIHAFTENNQLRLIVSYYATINSNSVLEELGQYGKIESHKAYSRQITIMISPDKLTEIVNLPLVQFIGAPEKEPESEGNHWQGTTRSNFISSAYNGLNFNGDGVAICIGEAGYVGLENLDFKGRLTETITPGNPISHKVRVTTRAGGAANYNPVEKGLAWGADVVSAHGGIDHEEIYNDYDVRFTNHSYGWSVSSGYNSKSRDHDLLVTDYPEVAIVYSSGNSGGSTGYAPYNNFSGWANITGPAKQSKNNWAVGSVTNVDVPLNSSSSGPTYDGRVIPQIVAEGSSGTSQAAPKLTGALAVLSEVYTSYYGSEAPSSLLKAVLLNTADDIENEGIDFKTGYGRVNVRRAHNLIQSNQIITASIDQGDLNMHTIEVPPNTAEVRVMVYWRDVAAVVNATTALVNDLDLLITDPNSIDFLPWVLSHATNPDSLNALPTRKADHLNNAEQVTIANPIEGSYTIAVNGFAIPSGPQEYFLVYEFLSDELQLTYPIQNDKFVPGSEETICWDSFGSTSSFTLEYQVDGGAWENIANPSASSRSYTWYYPPTVIGIQDLKVRVLRDGLVSESFDCTIGDRPFNLNVNTACIDQLNLVWKGIEGATSYKVYKLGAKYMEEVPANEIILNGTSAIISNVNLTEINLFAVSAVTDGKEGRRSNSYKYDHNSIPTVGSDVFPYTEGFEGSEFPILGSSLINSNNSTTWEAVNTSSPDCQGSNNTAIKLDNYNINTNGQQYVFRMPPIDLSSASSATLTFDVAHAPYSSSGSDSLKVEVTNTCGLPNTEYSKGGLTLASNNPAAYVTANFNPACTEWRTETINLDAYTGGDNTKVLIDFINVGNYGNNIFIDNINLTIVELPTTHVIEAKLFLQAAYDGSTMTTDLLDNNLIPLNQPFNTAPWNYAGSESVSSIPNDVTDWVLIELRDVNDQSTVAAQQAAFLRRDGSVIALDGSVGLTFNNLDNSSNYHLIIRPRNHLSVASANEISLPQTSLYDFTSVANVMGGSTQVADLGASVYGLFAGDIYSDGAFTIIDFNEFVNNPSSILQYIDADVNLDGHTTVEDYNWYRVNNSLTGVPLIQY